MLQNIASLDPVAIVVPNQLSAERIQNIFSKEIASGELLIQITGPHKIRESYQTLQEAHVGAILARGGTYQHFSQMDGSIPLVEMRISMLDILDALRGAEETGNFKQIYLLISERVTYDDVLCRRFIRTPVTYIPFRDVEDLQDKLNHLPALENVVIVGSGFVSELAERQPLPFDNPFLNILLNEDSLRLYYEQAKSLVQQMRQEIENLAQMQATLTQIEEGIIVLDSNGCIRNANRRGAALLGAEHQTLNGLSIHSLIPDLPFAHLLGREINTPYHHLLQLNDFDLNISITSYEAYRSERQYLLTVQTVYDIQRREQDIRFKLAHKGLTAQHTFQDIRTCEPAMEKLIDRAARVADEPGPVLLVGESGTGKELFAQSIHNQSSRRFGPFVAINCAALNETLLESELFGYVGGAFTGARKNGKAGLFELAHRGTIFLDEISSMPLGLQSKILRVLEERSIMRLGSDYVIPLDIRLISAADQNLENHVRAGTFRLDLYYRLNAFTLHLPPLRQRKNDIELLFRLYVEQYQRNHPEPLAISQDLLQLLQNHDWPGNVRELRNAAQRFVAFGGDTSASEILYSSNRSPALTDSQGHIDLRELSHTVEHLVIQSLLDSGKGKSETARIMGIISQALHQKINRSYAKNDDSSLH